jgi:hypothetical protein
MFRLTRNEQCIIVVLLLALVALALLQHHRGLQQNSLSKPVSSLSPVAAPRAQDSDD